MLISVKLEMVKNYKFKYAEYWGVVMVCLSCIVFKLLLLQIYFKNSRNAIFFGNKSVGIIYIIYV